jgi:TetR/AcrR family transcriptional repressor of nem operon
MIDTYLASEHRDDPATGCVMPTLAADVARHSPEVRATFTQEYQKSLDNMVPLLPENEDQRDEAMVLLAGMVGTMLLARAVDDPDLSERMLRVNREFYKRTFARHQSINDEHRVEG